MGGDLHEDVEEVGRGGDVDGGDGPGDGRNAVTFAIENGGAGAGIIPGIVGTCEEVLNDLGGGDEVDLIDVVKLRPGGDGKGGGGDGSGGERRRRH